MNTIKNQQFAKLLKALSGDIRLNIISYLASGEKCVCHIYNYFKLSQNLVSHHLGILRESGLIKDRKEGKWVYYSLNERNIEKVTLFLQEIVQKKRKEEDSC
ncbi:metalloregulator ArsR/SmtB family transcription factor [Candidatus Kuenenia sp.]|uniref:ArsR/SmtB family transcription factor n=1 Tax=Candidatus Kuenenia sp. TaxID=2499824 RepID=UPI00321FCB01